MWILTGRRNSFNQLKNKLWSDPELKNLSWVDGSVFDVDDESLPFEERNGFSFTNPDEEVSVTTPLEICFFL